MRNAHALLILPFMFLFFGCGQKEEKKPARVRWAQFLLSNGAVHVSLSRQGRELYAKYLEYATLTDYNEYPAGQYVIRVKSGKREILNKRIGLGTGGTYTLSLYGIPLKGQKTNQRSTAMELHQIVEGAAAKTPNAYLPQLDIMDDYFASAKNEAKIQLVNLAPGVESIKTSISRSGKEHVNFSAVRYPSIAKNKSVGAGIADIVIKLDNSDQVLRLDTIAIHTERLYTLFVIPGKKSYLTDLMLIKGATRKNQ